MADGSISSRPFKSLFQAPSLADLATDSRMDEALRKHGAKAEAPVRPSAPAPKAPDLDAALKKYGAVTAPPERRLDDAGRLRDVDPFGSLVPRSFTSSAPREASQPIPGRRPSVPVAPMAVYDKVGGLERGEAERTFLGDMLPEAPARIAQSVAAGYEKQWAAGLYQFMGAAAENMGISSVAEYYKQQGAARTALGEQIAPSQQNLGFGEAAAYSGVESIGGSAPAMLAGVAAGPAASLALMGATSAGVSYVEGERQGLDPRTNMVYAGTAGLIEIITERVPATKLLDDILQGTGFGKTIVRQLREELVNEQYASFFANANDWLMLPSNEGKPITAFLAEQPESIAQTFIATLTATVGQSTGAVALGKLARLKAEQPVPPSVPPADDQEIPIPSAGAPPWAAPPTVEPQAAPEAASVTPASLADLAEPPADITLQGGITDDQRAQLESLGFNPDAMTIVDAQEVLRQGIPERRRTPRAVRSDPMTPEGRAEMAAAFANDPAQQAAVETMKNAPRAEAPPRDAIDTDALLAEADQLDAQADVKTLTPPSAESVNTPTIEVIDDEGTTENASGESAASAEAIRRFNGMKARGEEFGYFDRAGRWTPLPDSTAVDVKALPGMTTGVLSHAGTFVRRDDNGGKVPSTLPKPVNVQAPVTAERPDSELTDEELADKIMAQMEAENAAPASEAPKPSRTPIADKIPSLSPFGRPVTTEEAERDDVSGPPRDAPVDIQAEADEIRSLSTELANTPAESANLGARQRLLDRLLAHANRLISTGAFTKSDHAALQRGMDVKIIDKELKKRFGVTIPDDSRWSKALPAAEKPVAPPYRKRAAKVTAKLPSDAIMETIAAEDEAERATNTTTSRITESAVLPAPAKGWGHQGVTVPIRTYGTNNKLLKTTPTETAAQTRDGLAVHKAFKDAGEKTGDVWNVTHINSGNTAMQGFRSESDAIAAADELLQAAGMDWTVDGTEIAKVIKAHGQAVGDKVKAIKNRYFNRYAQEDAQKVRKPAKAKSRPPFEKKTPLEKAPPGGWSEKDKVPPTGAVRVGTRITTAFGPATVQQIADGKAKVVYANPSRTSGASTWMDADKIRPYVPTPQVAPLTGMAPLGAKADAPKVPEGFKGFPVRPNDPVVKYVMPDSAKETPAVDPKRAALAEKRAKAKADIDKAADALKAELRKAGTTLNTGVPLPPKAVVIQTVNLVRAYAKSGIVEVDEGWQSFVEDLGELAASARRAFQLAWKSVHGTEPALADLPLGDSNGRPASEDRNDVAGDEPGAGDEAGIGRGSDAAADGRNEGSGDGPQEQPEQRPERKPGRGARTRRGRVAGADGNVDRPAGGSPGPVSTAGATPANFRIKDDTVLVEGGKVTRFKNNVAAIKLAKQIVSENRPATAKEQAELVKFVGWGGLKRELSDAQWDLKRDGILDDDEYHRAFQSTLNAHYTTPGMIRAIWQAVADMGFTRGRVLEPGMGVGHFFGLAPSEIVPTTMYGVELDTLTGQIAKLLYPQANIQVMGVQDATLPDGFFDLAISNVPFGNYKVADPMSGIPNYVRETIHNYYFAKALQKVRPGGIIAFVTTHGTLDARTSNDVREYLGREGDFLGAIRLPDTAFKENASAEVVTDIVFMRRRMPGAEPAHLFEGWTETEQRFKGPQNPSGVPVSKYFLAHPKRVIGTMAAEGTMYGGNGQELSVKTDLDGKAVEKQARKQLAALAQEIVKAGLGYQERQDDKPRTIPDASAPDSMLEGMYYLDGPILRRREGFTGVAATFEGMAKSTQARYAEVMRAYLPIREAYRVLVSTMSDPDADDAAVTKARKPLATAYDAFVAKHGSLTSKKSIITLDVYGAPVLSIEDWDSRAKTASKAAIFTKRTVDPISRPDKAESQEAALLVSLSETGGVDWPRIAGLLNETVDAAKESLIGSGRVFETPDGRFEIAERYLSGNVRSALELAKAAAKLDEKFDRNVSALEAVQPIDLPESRIATNFGAPWIPVDVVNEFITSLGGTMRASYQAVTAEWSINESSYYGYRVNDRVREWQTERVKLERLLELTLNNQQAVVRDRDGATEPVPTIEAQAKQEAIRKEFSRWAFTDDDRATRLARVYNDTHNAIVLPTYDGAHLTLPGMSALWRGRLRPHQINAIWRAVLSGNTYLAHTMGAGKTIVLAAIAMEYRRLGLARKPIIVIPKQTLSDYERFADYYPGARVLIGTKASTEGDERRRFMARIASGDWDAIVVTRDAMKKMPASDASWAEYLKEQIQELRDAATPEDLKALDAEKGDGDAPKKKKGGRSQLSDLAKKIQRLEERSKELEKKLKAKKDKGLTWEDLGIDMILADEAHAYRKIALATQLDQVAGIPVGPGSAFTNDMFIKARAIEAKTPGRGLVMASGTPLVNSVTEMYVIQRFMQRPAMRTAGVDKFDAWAATFGNIVTKWEADVTGTKLKLKRRFSEFSNMNGLIQQFRSFMDVMLPEDLNLPTPPVTGGEASVTAIDAGEDLKEFIKKLAARAENLDPRDRRSDNMLKISNDGRNAALDLRMVGMPPGGHKLRAIAAKVAKNYRSWDDRRGTQLVFMQIGVPGGNSWPAYEELRKEMVAAGIPDGEIAFISEAKTDADRTRMMADMREGRLRVMIGPRETMGTGVNVQKRLVALHHADPHWLPALIEQADGRGIRQGNIFFESASPERVDGFSLDIEHYVVKNSFDAFMWQAVARKGYMINQALRGNLSLDKIEEIGGGAVFDAAEIAAIATNNPVMMERAQLERQIQSLTVIADSHNRKQRDRANDLARLPLQIEKKTGENAELKAFLEAFDPKDIVIDGVAADDIDEINKAVRERFAGIEKPEDVEALKDAEVSANGAGFRAYVTLGTISGFPLSAYWEVNPVKRGSTKLVIDLNGLVLTQVPVLGKVVSNGLTMAPVSRLLENAEVSSKGRIAWNKDDIQRAEGALSDARAHADDVFPDQKELDAAVTRLEEIQDQLGKSVSVAQVADEPASDDEEPEPDELDDDEGGDSPPKAKGPRGDASVGTVPMVVRQGQSAEFDDDLKALTGIDTARPVQVPELVEFIESVGGETKILRALRTAGARGMHKHGTIALVADLFAQKNRVELGRVLAHEIGHLVDWLPDSDMRKGNILGRLQSLHRFLKHSYTSSTGDTIRRDDVNAELKALSEEWRPWPEAYEPSYKKYRDSSRELYADAISALLNDPAVVQEKAPIFFQEFFAELDRKPEAKASYFEIMDVLSGTPDELIERRRGRTREMFDYGNTKALDLVALKLREKELQAYSLWDRLRIQQVDRNTALTDRISDWEKRTGKKVSQQDDPRYLLEERAHIGATAKAFVSKHFEPVIAALKAADIDWNTFGELLFYERIIHDPKRAEIANSKGIGPAEAQDMLDAALKPMSREQRRVINAQADTFRQALKLIAEQAHEAGLYSDEMYAEMQKNPAYVTFRVLEYLDQNVTSTVYRQVGTLKDIQHPAESSIVKALVTLRAAEHNIVKRDTFAWFDKEMPGEFEHAPQTWNGRGQSPAPPKNRDLKMVTFKVKGKTVGRYVDPYVAHAFETLSTGDMHVALQALNFVTSKWLRPVFTTMNPGFQTFNFVRDFVRFWKNMPGLTMATAIKRYAQAAPIAAARAFPLKPGAQGWKWRHAAEAALIEAGEAKVLNFTLNDVHGSDRIEDTNIDQILADAGLSAYAQHKGRLKSVVGWIAAAGDLIETLPKAAAILHLTQDGRRISDLTPSERSLIRRKVGSPDYLQRGTATPATNVLFLFSNAIIQGTRADLEVATDPKTAGGWWFKTALVNIGPKMVLRGLALAAAASAAGAGGDDDDDESTIEFLARSLRGASEYDKTNYIVIPLGFDEKGESIYVRLPQDDTGKFIGALVWKAMGLAMGDKDVVSSLMQVADVTAGQVPGLNPLLRVPVDIAAMASGNNIHDSYRSRMLFTTDELNARDGRMVGKFLRYEFQQLGGSIVWNFATGAQEKGTLKKVVELPVLSNIVGRWIRVGDRGMTEQLRDSQGLVKRDESRARLDEKPLVESALALMKKTAPPDRGKVAKAQATEIVARVYAGLAADATKQKVRTIEKKIRMGMVRGQADPYVEVLMSGGSTAQKLDTIANARKAMSPPEFQVWMKRGVSEGIVSEALAKAARKGPM